MKGKFFRKLCMTFMVGVMVCSNVGAILASANNHSDTPYSSYSGDGSDSSTEIRDKTDRTKVYAYNQNTDKTHRIEIAGTNSTSGYGDVFSYDNCTYGTYYYDVKPRAYKYMSSAVYERGYRHAFLVYAEANHKSGNLYGLWSPDSIGGN